MKFLGLVFVPLLCFAQTDGPGIKAFESTLYPLLRQSCTDCHGDNPISAAHSSSDLEEAYEESKWLVDFLEPEQSRFITMIQKKHWLKRSPEVRDIDEAKFLSEIQAWWDQGESKSLEGIQVVFKEQQILVNQLPRADQDRDGYRRFEWVHPENPGLKLRAKVQHYKDQKEKLPRAIRIISIEFDNVSSKTVELGGIQFVVGGQLNVLDNVYETVKAKLTAGLGPVTLSEENLILSLPPEGPVNIAVRFKKFEMNEEPFEWDTVSFEKNVVPALRYRNDLFSACIECHGVQAKFSSSTPIESELEDEVDSLQWAKKLMAWTSNEWMDRTVLMRKIEQGAGNHQVASEVSRKEIRKWLGR